MREGFAALRYNGNINMMNKKAWKKMEITRVKLNPEQAVLSCCDVSVKGRVTDVTQCVPEPFCGYDMYSQILSS